MKNSFCNQTELLNLLSIFSIHKESGPDYEHLKHLTFNLCVSTKKGTGTVIAILIYQTIQLFLI